MPKKNRNDTWLGVLAFLLAVISVVCFFTAYQLHAQAKQNSNALPSRVLVGHYSKDCDTNEGCVAVPELLNQVRSKGGTFSDSQAF